MSRTVEIPQERWPSFLRLLNRMANGRPVRLEVAGRDWGDQDMANQLPLLQLEFETKGSERGNLVIAVGSDGGELTHAIEKPTHMAVGLNEANEPQFLAIDEDGGAATIIHFERLPPLERDYGAAP